MKFDRVARTLGRVFKVYAVFLLLPVLASLYWDSNVAPAPLTEGLDVEFKVTTVSFLLTFVFVFLLGFVLTTLAGPHVEELREREAYFIVGAGWLFCAALGAIPFLLTGATRDVSTALFEAMSAITTTGFTALSDPMETYPESLHVWRASLQFFGGLGIVLVAVAVIGRLTEGAVKLLGGEAGGDVTRLRPKLSQTAKSLFGVFLGLNVLAFVSFWLALHYTGPRYGWKESAYHGLVHAFTTVSTGGMSTRTGSIGDFHSDLFNALVFFFLFVGGTSFVLLYRVMTIGPGELWRNVEFRFYVFLWFMGSLGVAGFLYLQGYSWQSASGHGPFTVLAAMTTGGHLTTNVDPFSDGAKLILLILMISGAMVGSTAGAVKVGRIFLLFRLTYYEIRRLLHPHAIVVVKMGGRVFPEETIRRIIVFFFTYVTIFIGGALAFSALDHDFETSVAGSAASLGNVGFSWGDFAPGLGGTESGPAERLISLVLMWLGRLEIFAVLLLFTPATYRN